MCLTSSQRRRRFAVAMIARTRRATLAVNARLDLMVNKLDRKARVSRVGRLISNTVTLRVPLAKAATVVANVVAAVAANNRLSSHINLKASRVTHTLSGRRVRTDMAAVTGRDRVARISSATRRVANAAGTGTERFNSYIRRRLSPAYAGDSGHGCSIAPTLRFTEHESVEADGEPDALCIGAATNDLFLSSKLWRGDLEALRCVIRETSLHRSGELESVGP